MGGNSLRQQSPYELLSSKLALINPIEHAVFLNSVVQEVSVEPIGSPEVQYVIDEMLRIAAGKDEEGGAQMVGLAAPQVGVDKRIVIIDTAAGGTERQEQAMLVLINSRIVEVSDELVDGREGCWSCDDFCANVPRHSWVVVEAFDRDGEPVQMRLEGFTARIAQHEADHLDGIRCIDRVPAGEDWRLHLVRKEDPAEFERYRKEWATWQQTFPREAWEKFKQGIEKK